MCFNHQPNRSFHCSCTTAKITWPIESIAEIACIHVKTRILRITNAIGIKIVQTFSSTHPNGIQLVALAVAVLQGNVCTSAFKNGTVAIAYITLVQFPYAIVDIVADAVHVRVNFTPPPAITKSILLVAVAIAIACGNPCASAWINLSWPIAYSTGIQCTYTWVHVVTHPVCIFISLALPTTNVQCIQNLPFAIARSIRNAVSTAHAALVQLQTRTVVIIRRSLVVASRCIRASASVAFPFRGKGSCSIKSKGFDQSRVKVLTSGCFLALWQNLDIQLPIDAARGGDLKNQYPAF